MGCWVATCKARLLRPLNANILSSSFLCAISHNLYCILPNSSLTSVMSKTWVYRLMFVQGVLLGVGEECVPTRCVQGPRSTRHETRTSFMQSLPSSLLSYLYGFWFNSLS